MKEAAVPGYRLSKARPSMKVLTSLGMLGLLLGLMFSALLTISRTGLSSKSVSAYYLGEGSSNEISDDLADITSASVARPFDELVEVTHLHLMGGSLMLFLLCHLLSLCPLREATRTSLYVVSFTSFIVTFTLPWLIIYVHPLFAQLFGPSIITFMLALLVLCLLPLKEMWLPQNSSNKKVVAMAASKKAVNGP